MNHSNVPICMHSDWFCGKWLDAAVSTMFAMNINCHTMMLYRGIRRSKKCARWIFESLTIFQVWEFYSIFLYIFWCYCPDIVILLCWIISFAILFFLFFFFILIVVVVSALWYTSSKCIEFICSLLWNDLNWPIGGSSGGPK